MAQVINTNIMSLNAQRNLNSSSASMATSIQRLSSGLRINSAKDDAAGLAISSRMSTQISGMTVASRNANDGISLAQTAEGALSSISSNLQRIRDLAVQSASDTNTADDRASLQKEVDQLTAEISRVVDNTDFNGTKLLNGERASFTIQVGSGSSADNQITISTVNMNDTVTALTGDTVGDATATFDISSSSGVATAALSTLDSMLQSVNNARADLGAIQNRFTSVISNLATSSENLTDARSRIQDTDYAAETAELTRTQILQQAGTAMLAQAKSVPQNVLTLLQ